MIKTFLLISLISTSMTSQVIISDFLNNINSSSWKIVDDIVMGGKSDGNFEINQQGNAVFSGLISLENNGGFSSVRCQFPEKIVISSSKIFLRVKGDGNEYKFRIKQHKNDYYSYSVAFKTSKEWEIIEINTSEMRPVFRGRNLNLPNFSSVSFEELSILIGNKKDEDFRLEIDKIFSE